MDVCEQWWRALPEVRRRDARAVTGEIPDWMVTSLGAAGVPVVEAELVEHDGRYRTAFLLPTYLADFIAGADMNGVDSWLLLSIHGRAIVVLGAHPGATVADVADKVGMTVGGARRVLNDLVEADLVRRTVQDRRAYYTIEQTAPARHDLFEALTVGRLVDAFSRAR